MTSLVPVTCHKPFNRFPTGLHDHICQSKKWFSLYRIVTQVLLALRGKGKSPKQHSQLQASKYSIYSLHNCLKFVPRLVNRNGLISEMTIFRNDQSTRKYYYKQLVHVKKVLDPLAEMFTHKCLNVYLFKCCIFSPF